MKSQLLIDAIVRQTTVLIAQLSTVERAPLCGVANDVLHGLVKELENQGVAGQAAADIFGMSLRSYQQKVRRLGESTTQPGTSLWTAVQDFLADRGSVRASDVEAHFQKDDAASVRGILRDLVRSGFVVRSGSGAQELFRVATAQELAALASSAKAASSQDGLSALIWVYVFREGPVTLEELERAIPAPPSELEEALEALTGDGRISKQLRGGEEAFVAEEVLIPVGNAAGWEAAIADHHRSVCSAIGSKLTDDNRASASVDEVGGTTLTFDLWPGHPKEQAVRGLLKEMRAKLLPLWDEVSEDNDGASPSARYQVHFYFGQYVVEEDELP